MITLAAPHDLEYLVDGNMKGNSEKCMLCACYKIKAVFSDLMYGAKDSTIVPMCCSIIT